MEASNGADGASTDVQISSVLLNTTVNRLAHEAYATQGFSLNGRRSTAQFRKVIFEALYRDGEGVVHGRKERGAKATLRDDLQETVFDKQPKKREIDSQDNPDLAADVWKKLQNDLWAECKVGYGSKMQDLITAELGNGHVLCRTKLGSDWAVYITDDYVCVMNDLVKRDNETAEGKLDQIGDNRELLIALMPDNAKKFLGDYKKRMAGALESNVTRLQLAFETATSESADGDGTSDAPGDAPGDETESEAVDAS